jgi:hypothetical protein
MMLSNCAIDGDKLFSAATRADHCASSRTLGFT